MKGKYTKKRGYLRKRRNYAKKAKVAKVSTAVKTYVSRALSRTIENKSVQVNGGFQFGNVLESPDFSPYPMAPSASYWTISQGVGAGARIGNAVKVKKVTLNYILRPTPYDAFSNVNPCPAEVQLMLGYVKQRPSEIPTNLDILRLYQNGSGISGPVGTLRDIITPINNDYWTIKKRWTHKVGFSINDGTGGLAGQQYFANNDFKMNIKRSINITKYLPSHFRFDDTAAPTTTKNLFLLMTAVQANGSGGGAAQQFAAIEFWVDCIYEDA